MLGKKKSMVLAAMLLLGGASGLSACGGSSDKTDGSSNEEKASPVKIIPQEDIPALDWDAIGWQADPEELEWKSDTSSINLDYYINFSWFSLNWKDATAQKITQKTGVDLMLTKPVSDDNQKLNMMISGNQLPDLMTLDRKDAALQTMIENDMLWSLDELIDEYAPQMRDILPKELLENYKSEDGQTYALTTWVQGEAWQESAKKHNQIVGVNQPVWTIRKDYYDEIGRPEIKTMDDFIDVLTQISEKHPDKIAFYPADGALLNVGTAASLSNVGAQFGLSENTIDIDGHLKWLPRDEKFQTAVTYLNEMYKKGLLTKDPFIDSKDVAKAKIDKGDVISFSWALGEAEKVPADNPDTQYEVLPPFDTYEQTRTGAGWLATVIPKTCKDPERAIKFLEYMASVEGHEDASWGNYGDTYSGDVVEGAHWNVVDGKPVQLADYMKDKNADWGGVASKNGLGEYWFACNELLWNFPQWDESNEKMNEYNTMFGPKVVYKPELDVENPVPTSDNGIILQKAQSLLQKNFVKMVTAEDPASEYQAFIKEIDALGMDKVETYWDGFYQNNLKE